MPDVLTDERSIGPITDLESGQEFLEQLPLGRSAVAEEELAAFITALRAAPPPLEVYLTLLEQTRLPLQFVTEDLARCYIGKPLPLGQEEEKIFLRLISAWRRIARAYDHCAQLDNTEDTPDHAARIALILHRCISYMGTAIIEHHRARREIPPGLWLELHGYYDTAEEWRVANVPVIDTLDPQQRNSTCMSMFAMLLLVDMSNPYGYGIRDQGIIRRWASNWASLVEIKPISVIGTKPEFIVDLIQDTGLYPASFDSAPSPSQRYLDTTKLSEIIIESRQSLKKKQYPSQIGLGEDCTPNQAMRLLLSVSKPWSQISTPRRFRRHNASGQVSLCSGFNSIYFHINNQNEFTQPERRSSLFSKKTQGKVLTVALSASDDGTQVAQTTEIQKYPHDEWEMINQSASGFRIVRSRKGDHVEHSQLIALKPHNGTRFLLGQITWLMQGGKNRLVAGIAILPGLPQAVAARPVDEINQSSKPYERAFLLPKIDSVNEEASLVLPPGWFQRGRIIEVSSDQTFHVRLTRAFKRGTDFERIGYEIAL